MDMMLRRIFLVLIITIPVLPPVHLYGAEYQLIPQLSVKEQYNDNIFFDPNDSAKVGDFATIISPSLSLTDRTERLSASLQSLLNRYQYSDDQSLDATDQFYSGNIKYRLTERMNVSAEVGYTKDSQADRDIEATGLVLGTEERRRQHYAGSAESILSEKTTGILSYSYDKDTFDNLKFSNSTTQDMTLTLNHNLDAILPLTIGRITMGSTLYDYVQTDVTEYSIMAGATRKITETVEFSGDIGIQQLRTRNKLFGVFTESTKPNDTIIGQAALTYHGELSTASLSYASNVRSVSGESGIARYSSVGLNLSRQFTYEFKGSLTAGYNQNKRENNGVFSTPLDENTWGVHPSLSYNFTNDLWMEASYRYYQIKDKVNDQRSVQSLYCLTMNWQYPIPH